MNRKYNVFGIGNALVDYEIEISDEFLESNKVEKGLMTLVEEDRQKALIEAVSGKVKKRQSGGSAANSMIALAQFGGSGFYTCKVADDEDGTLYLEEMETLGLKTNLKELPRGTTGKCLVMVTPDAQRTMNTFLGITSDLSKNEIDEESLKNAEFVYIEGYLVSSPTGIDAIKKVKELARENGVKIAYTFSDPAMVKFFNEQSKEAVSGGLDMLFANEEEARLFTDTTSEEDAFEKLKDAAKEFIMTRSEKGAWVWDGQNKIEIPAHPTKALDTTGAGDIFAGAYLYGITNGLSRLQSGQLASLAGSKVVSQFGPRLDNELAKSLLENVK